MNWDKIEDNSLGYRLLGNYTKFWFTKFFRERTAEGVENIPDEQVPIIFAPNHQNSMMDPLAVIFASKSLGSRQMIWLARSDVFRNPLAAKFLKFVKIMPVFRERDGKDTLDKNEEIFQKCADALAKKTPVATFPEAKHHDKRVLLPLKKGLPRIAFMAAEKCNWSLDLQIVPVGINYAHYQKINQTLHVVFGKPIRVNSFKEIYLADNTKALNLLRNAIDQAIRPLMIDIQNAEYYPTYEIVRRMYNSKMCEINNLNPKKNHDKLTADKKLIKSLDKLRYDHVNVINSLKENSLKYDELLTKNNLRDWLFEKEQHPVSGMLLPAFILLIGFPFFLYGFLNNLITWYLPQRMVRKMPDKQFHLSVKLGVSAVLFPIVFLLQTIIVLLAVDPNWIALVYFFSLMPMGFVALNYSTVFKKMIGKIRYNKLRSKNSTEFADMLNARDQVFHTMDEVLILKKYKTPEESDSI